MRLFFYKFILLFAGAFLSVQSAFAEESCARPFASLLRKNFDSALEHLKTPVPFDTQFEIFAVSKTKHGEIYHIRPSALADEVKRLEGAKHVPQTTYFKEAEPFFRFMGIEEACHPSVGCYYSTLPSPEEFMARKKVWNEMAIRDGRPDRVIEMNYVGGDIAPMQKGMARNMVEQKGATHMQNPLKVYTERYAPIGGGQHEEGAFFKLKVDPNTGRAVIKGSLGRHDSFELVNSIYIPRKVLDLYVNQADAHLKMLDLLKGKNIRITGQDMEDFKETFRGFVNTKNADALAIEPSGPGISAERYQEFLLHNAMAAQHTDFHLGGWLARNREGIDPKNIPEFGWGNVFQTEIQMHLARAGTRAPGSKPPFLAPMVIENFKLADDSGKVLTLEAMLQHTIVRQNAAFRAGFDRIYTAVAEQARGTDVEAKNLLEQLEAFRVSHPIFLERDPSAKEIKALASEYRLKVKAFSSYGKE